MTPRTAARLRAAARGPPSDAPPLRSPSADPADDSDGGWGFSTRLPSLRRLQEEVAAAGGAPSASLSSGLADSAAARHPGAAGAMLAAFWGDPGATLTGLAGTATADAVDGGALTMLRTRLRSSLDAAWAADAAARGDAAATAGDAAAASALYEEALRLDGRCAAAWMGKGALAERARRLHDAADAYGGAGTAGGDAAAARCQGRLRELGLPESRDGLLVGREGDAPPPPPRATSDRPRSRSRSRSRERHKESKRRRREGKGRR